MRDVIDITKDIDVDTLSFTQQILLGFRYGFYNSNLQVKRRAKKKREADRAAAVREDNLKDLISIAVQDILVMGSHPDVARKKYPAEYAILGIDRDYLDILDKVLESKAFLQFNYTIIDALPDLVEAVPELKVYIKFTKKELV